jgi:phage-related tail fiber protein
VSVPRGWSFLNRDDEMRGSSEAVADIPEMARPTWSVNSRLYPDTLGVMLAAMFGLSATGETGATHYTATAGNGIITDPDSVAIPTGATRHVWVSPFGRPARPRRRRSSTPPTRTRACSSRLADAAPRKST